MLSDFNVSKQGGSDFAKEIVQQLIPAKLCDWTREFL